MKHIMKSANANELVQAKVGVLDPGGSAKRCEVAAVLHRFINMLAE